MTEISFFIGTSLQREGKPTMNPITIQSAECPLAGLGDTELVARIRHAWFDALTTNTFAEVRACQAEALRRGKAHLYDQGYIEFWLGIGIAASKAA